MGLESYREPLRYLDLSTSDPSLKLAPNFQLDELAQVVKGQWAVISPAAVQRLQDMRNTVGAILVTSGYRSPGYNATIAGAAASSRHLYGDGFDLVPQSATLATLETVCQNNGGYLVQYTDHVHCDWRNDLVDEVFFGPPGAEVDPGQWWFEGDYGARLRREADAWIVEADGFDEGDPVVEWAALDADGRLLDSRRSRAYGASREVATLEALVGGRVHLTVDLTL
jgi:hypothetical protein